MPPKPKKTTSALKRPASASSAGRKVKIPARLKSNGGPKHASALPIDAWHFVQGKWVSGNPLAISLYSHASWMASAVFDGARAFDGVTPDLDRHCARAVRSAEFIGLRSPLRAGDIEDIAREGIQKFPAGTHLYIRPFLWAEDGLIAPDPASTQIAISCVMRPLPEPAGWRVCFSSLRRPSPETAPTEAKAVALYAQASRASAEARARGFDEAVMLDLLGNVAEFTCANIWIVKDGVAMTPVPNGTFLNGITRQRLIQLLEQARIPVRECRIRPQDVWEADEIFSTGNYSKVYPVIALEQKKLPIGPIFRRARQLYFEFAHSGKKSKPARHR